MPTLTVLMGVPGSGKTTWARTNAPGQVLCSTDRLRTDRGLTEAGVVAYLNALRSKAERSLAAGRDVIVDACNVRRNERSRWWGVARAQKARARLVVVYAPVQTALQVQRDRTHGVADVDMRVYEWHMRRALAITWSAVTSLKPTNHFGRATNASHGRSSMMRIAP
jgi:predicted kinase